MAVSSLVVTLWAFAAGAEFSAFVRLYEQLPDLGLVLRGQGSGLRLPDEPSVRYAAGRDSCEL